MRVRISRLIACIAVGLLSRFSASSVVAPLKMGQIWECATSFDEVPGVSMAYTIGSEGARIQRHVACPETALSRDRER